MNMIVLKLFAVDRQKKKKEKSKGMTLRLTWGILLGSFSDDFFKLQDKKTTKKLLCTDACTIHETVKAFSFRHNIFLLAFSVVSYILNSRKRAWKMHLCTEVWWLLLGSPCLKPTAWGTLVKCKRAKSVCEKRKLIQEARRWCEVRVTAH